MLEASIFLACIYFLDLAVFGFYNFFYISFFLSQFSTLILLSLYPEFYSSAIIEVFFNMEVSEAISL